MKALGFRIGGTQHERVEVIVRGANDDGWLPSEVHVRVGGFSGTYETNLDVWAMARFASQLRELYAQLAGTAVFSSYEKQLELTLVGNGRGQIALKGEAMDYAGTGNKLLFELHLDQTDLPVIQSDLDAIVAAYPPPNR